MATKTKTTARTTSAVQGARINNRKNITLKIPRIRLIVTGLNGSGKFALAFNSHNRISWLKRILIWHTFCQSSRGWTARQENWLGSLP